MQGRLSWDEFIALILLTRLIVGTTLGSTAAIVWCARWPIDDDPIVGVEQDRFCDYILGVQSQMKDKSLVLPD